MHDEQKDASLQDLETSLDSAVVRTGSSVAVAENAGVARSVPAHLAQFAEAQRIIVLDAIRTDLLQPDAASESSHRTNGAMNGERISFQRHFFATQAPQDLDRASALLQSTKRSVNAGPVSWDGDSVLGGEGTMMHTSYVRRLGAVSRQEGGRPLAGQGGRRDACQCHAPVPGIQEGCRPLDTPTLSLCCARSRDWLLSRVSQPLPSLSCKSWL